MATMKTKQFIKIAAFFFLLTVVSRGISVANACLHEACSTECCDGYVCVGGECEPETCEDHVGNACDPQGRDCCESLVCKCDNTCALCKGVGQGCDPNACYDECCGRDCVNMGGSLGFQCQNGGNK